MTMEYIKKQLPGISAIVLFLLVLIPRHSIADTIPGGLVSISFDDGYDEQYTDMLPALERDGIKATFYIITDTLVPGKYSGFITPEQVRDLASKGQEIGSHTIHHADLTTVATDTARTEIFDSKKYLEDLLGIRVRSIAYPYGHFNASIVEMEKEAGYTAARATDSGEIVPGEERYSIAAIVPKNDTPLSEVESKIDDAVRNGTWLNITFHRINDPSDVYDNDLGYVLAVLDYIKNNNIRTATVSEGADIVFGVASSTNEKAGITTSASTTPIFIDVSPEPEPEPDPVIPKEPTMTSQQTEPAIITTTTTKDSMQTTTDAEPETPGVRYTRHQSWFEFGYKAFRSLFSHFYAS